MAERCLSYAKVDKNIASYVITSIIFLPNAKKDTHIS